MDACIEMNPVIEAINARRSVRAYRADKVDRQLIGATSQIPRHEPRILDWK
jgi:hypothetical protein